MTVIQIQVCCCSQLEVHFYWSCGGVPLTGTARRPLYPSRSDGELMVLI
jgi:hypothetical protein